MRATKQRMVGYRYSNLAAAHMAAIVQFAMLARLRPPVPPPSTLASRTLLTVTCALRECVA